MLGKLLKYEFKSTARTFLPMYLVLLVFALLGRFSLAGMDNIRLTENDFLNVLFAIAIFAYVMIIFSVLIITFIVIVQRFYKNLTGDEGYLMHTLPVSTHQLISAKVISGMVWEIASTLVIFLSLFVLLFQPWFLADLGEAFREMGGLFADLSAEVGAWRVVTLTVEILVSMLIGVLSSTLMIYAAITIGHTFKKHRVLGAVGAYMGLMMLCQVISGFVGVAVMVPYQNARFIEAVDIVNLLMSSMGVALLVTVGFTIAWYFITHYVLTSQLNLE